MPVGPGQGHAVQRGVELPVADAADPVSFVVDDQTGSGAVPL